MIPAEDIGEKLKTLTNKIKTVFQLMPLGKHMIGRDLGRLESTNRSTQDKNLVLNYCARLIILANSDFKFILSP